MEERILNKIKTLEAAGMPVYPARYERGQSSEEIHSLMNGKGPGEKLESVSVSAAGRITQVRLMGKTCFFHIQDGKGKVQAYLRQDDLGDQFRLFVDTAELGDIVGVQGFPFKTKTGEPSIHAKSWRMLSKALRPPPEKWHGLKDVETRFRQRYLDLISNKDAAGIFAGRAKIIQAVRSVLDSRKFLEVETPMFHPTPGGAAAKPFVTFHEALEAKLFLRIATELYLKRVVIGGIERVYEIGKCFRNEGVDTQHNPEFTMLEAYQSYADYNDMAELAESIIKEAARRVDNGAVAGASFGHERLPELWARHVGGKIEDVLEDTYRFKKSALIELAQKHRVPADLKAPAHKIFDKIMDLKILTQLPDFCFIFDYPTAISPLAKPMENNPALVERFELFYKGTELANAFSELNDPAEQRRRMEHQAAAKEKEKDEEIPPLDEDFLTALEHGMPPTGGLGIGIDRLCMTLLGIDSIREVILFPTLKPEAAK